MNKLHMPASSASSDADADRAIHHRAINLTLASYRNMHQRLGYGLALRQQHFSFPQLTDNLVEREVFAGHLTRLFAPIHAKGWLGFWGRSKVKSRKVSTCFLSNTLPRAYRRSPSRALVRISKPEIENSRLSIFGLCRTIPGGEAGICGHEARTNRAVQGSRYGVLRISQYDRFERPPSIARMKSEIATGGVRRLL